MFLVDAFTYVQIFFPLGDKRFSKSFQGYHFVSASRADAGNGLTAKSVEIVAKL